jgi:hypothetical protein
MRDYCLWDDNVASAGHSSLGYLTPQEFATSAWAESCGKDGGYATLENAARFPLSHSHDGRRQKQKEHNRRGKSQHYGYSFLHCAFLRDLPSCETVPEDCGTSIPSDQGDTFFCPLP